MAGRNEGFSLVEVVLALGIVAFALVSILGLFPVALGAAKDGATETHAAMIAQLIAGQIRSQTVSQATFAVGPDPTLGSGSFNLPGLSNSQTCAVYDETGQPVSRITVPQFADPSSLSATVQRQCTYMVQLTVVADTPAVGLSQIKIDVVYPGLAAGALRKTNTFITLARNKD